MLWSQQHTMDRSYKQPRQRRSRQVKSNGRQTYFAAAAAVAASLETTPGADSTVNFDILTSLEMLSKAASASSGRSLKILVRTSVRWSYKLDPLTSVDRKALASSDMLYPTGLAAVRTGETELSLLMLNGNNLFVVLQVLNSSCSVAARLSR